MGAIAVGVNYQVMKDLVAASGVKYMPYVPLKADGPSELSQFGIWQCLKAIRNYTSLCNTHKVAEHWSFKDFADDPIRMMPLDKLISTYHLEPLQRSFERIFTLYG